MDYKAIAKHCAESLADGADAKIDGWGPVFYLLEQASVPLDAWRDVGDDWQPVPNDDYDPTGELPEVFTRINAGVEILGAGVWVVGNLLCVVGIDNGGPMGGQLIHWLFERPAA